MPLDEVLDTVLVKSLLPTYHYAFSTILALLGSPGAALIAFGVVVNSCLTPLYLRMERTSRARAASRREMDDEIARLKKHYRGRELYYYVRTVHRQFGYRPISVIFSSGALYLEVGVFLTVYRYLSLLWMPSETSFLGIPDLGHPDGLVFGVNLLPIVMTLLNIASALIYSPSRTARHSSLVIAVLFLILLYDSKAALVLYWTSSNAFSLARNWIERRVIPNLAPATKQRLARVFASE